MKSELVEELNREARIEKRISQVTAIEHYRKVNR